MKKQRSNSFGIVAVLALTGLLMTPAVLAHSKHHGHHNRHHRKQIVRAPVRHHVAPVYHDSYRPIAPRRPPVVVAPDVIRTVHVEAYRPYLDGRVYYRPHRHYHEVYSFPVYNGGRYVLEPHYYCSGRRVPPNYLSFDGPHLSIGLRF